MHHRRPVGALRYVQLVALPPRPVPAATSRGSALTTAERRRYEELQADRLHIDTAAAWLHTQAWQEQYAGLHDQDRAFMTAMWLDTPSLQLDRIPPGARIRSGSGSAGQFHRPRVAGHPAHPEQLQGGNGGPVGGGHARALRAPG